jgi:hypothetical protein
MLSDQCSNARPRRQREQSLDKASADERARPEALAAAPLRRECVDQGGYFGGVEEFRYVANGRATRYLARCHASFTSYGRAPGSANCAGAYSFVITPRILPVASDGVRQ